MNFNSFSADVAFFVADPGRQLEGEQLAQKYHIPFVKEYLPYRWLLVLTDKRLELHVPEEKIKPLYVDFEDAPTQQRLKKNRGRSELIARALGIKGTYLPTVIDATAGLGGDALILAHLGCQVQMVERSPVIFALLEDGYRRAKQCIVSNWLSNMTLILEDAKQYLQLQVRAGQFADVVYLDPMFPERLKAALVKKEMRILKSIVGDDEDAAELFLCAKQCALKRVVVKRPLHAEYITAEKPTLIHSAKTCRFDVYLK